MIPAKLDMLRSARRLILGCKILALEYGYWRSIRRQESVASDGCAIPWYTYPCIEYLKGFDASRFDVFEFGAGNSSRFWAKRARSVTSVEHDAAWHAKVARGASDNQRVLLRQTPEEYVGELASDSRHYDVIVVDGQWRPSCVEQAITRLSSGGFILLDNSDRFPSCCRFLRDNGFFQIDFHGPGPINPYYWTTSIFVRAENNLQDNFMAASPIGGLGVITE